MATAYDSLSNLDSAFHYYSQILNYNDNNDMPRLRRAEIFQLRANTFNAFRDYEYLYMTNGIGNITLNIYTEKKTKVPIEKVAYSRLNVDEDLDKIDLVLLDLNICIDLDYKKAECLYRRASILHNLGYYKEACYDLFLSDSLGFTVTDSVLENYSCFEFE